MLWKHAAAREKEYMSNRSALTPDVKGLLLLHEYQETGKKFLHETTEQIQKKPNTLITYWQISS